MWLIGDRQGRRSPEVLEALKDYTLLCTDQNGWIELTLDGERIWVDIKSEPPLVSAPGPR